MDQTQGRRAFWTFFDQGLSSLTNAGLSIVVARAVSDEDFGAFSLALVTFSFAIGICRGLVSDPFLVRYSHVDRDTRRAAATRATGTALAFGVFAGAICAIAAALVQTPNLRLALLALAVSLPGLMLQDAWRNVFFAAGRPAMAALNDGIWAVLQFGALGALLTSGVRAILPITLAWGVAALVAAIAGGIQAGLMPSPREAMNWLHETRDLNVRMALDFALNMGAVNLATYVVTAIVGLVGVGAIRAAQVLTGPLSLLFSGSSSFVLPVLARRVNDGRSILRPAVLCSAATGSLATIWVLVLLLIPRSAGEALLGASWNGARSVLLPVGIVSIAVGLVLGASLSLKALSRADQMLRVTLMQAPVMLGLGVAGAFMHGAPGAAYGFAIAQVLGMVICWIIFVRAERQHMHTVWQADATTIIPIQQGGYGPGGYGPGGYGPY